ncbi:MAG: hypothetical protein GY950_16965 [bacterium]|nr:hypothetical protein [bacterium]
MIINKSTIRGVKGTTVCYTLENFRFDNSDGQIKWDAFKFYTPLGDLTDDEGFKYFDVPADDVPIDRDADLSKGLMVMVTKDNGIEAIETLEGAESDMVSIGLEGDIIVSGYIPSDPGEDIIIDYKEVTA